MIIQETKTECGHGPHAAVVTGASANGGRDIAGALFQCVCNQFSRSVRSCFQRVSPCGRKQRKAGSLGHFNQGRGFTGGIFKNTVGSLCFFKKRIGNGNTPELSASRGKYGLKGAFAAVRDRNAGDFGFREMPSSFGGNNFYNLTG